MNGSGNKSNEQVKTPVVSNLINDFCSVVQISHWANFMSEYYDLITAQFTIFDLRST